MNITYPQFRFERNHSEKQTTPDEKAVRGQFLSPLKCAFSTAETEKEIDA